jgi:hypothetical protein
VIRRSLVLAIALATAACTGTPEPTPTAPVPHPSPSLDGIPEFEGEGAAMPPGPYVNRDFDPDVTFRVGPGWEGGHSHAEFFDVQGHGGLAGFAHPEFVSGRDAEQTPADELSAAEALDLIRGNPEMRCRDSSVVAVGDAEAPTLRCRPDGPQEVFGGPEGEFVAQADWVIRVSAFEVDGILLLAIAAQIASDADVPAFLAAADQVFASAEFD